MIFKCIPFDFETVGLSMKWVVLTVNPLQTHIKMRSAFYGGFFLCVCSKLNPAAINIGGELGLT